MWSVDIAEILKVAFAGQTGYSGYVIAKQGNTYLYEVNEGYTD